MLQIPFFQNKLALAVAAALEAKIHSRVTIEKVDLGLMGRIIINDLCVYDQSQKLLLSASRVAANPDISSIVRGQISISTVQLFGFEIHLYKDKPNSAANYQYILDAFASKEKKKSETDIRINSILIRRGYLTYDKNYVARTPHRINFSHIGLKNLSATISLKALRKDTINANIKKISFDEQSGFSLRKLSLKVEGNRKKAIIENAELQMPETHIKFSTIDATYDFDSKDFLPTINLSGQILPSYVVLSDVKYLVPRFDNFDGKLFLNTAFRGTINNILLTGLTIHTENNDLFLLSDVHLSHIIGNSPSKRIAANISKLEASSTGIRFVLSNLTRNFEGVPAPITRLGNITFNGNLNLEHRNVYAKGNFRTSLGQISTDVNVYDWNEIDGKVNSDQFLLGTLIANDDLGNIAINADVKSRLANGKLSKLTINGNVPFVEFKNYKYSNIKLNGTYDKNNFNGSASIDDQNVNATIDGNIDLARRIPLMKFTASIENLRPAMLNLTNKYAGTDFSANINADFEASDIDNISGSLSVTDLTMNSPEKKYKLENFAISSENDNKQKRLKLTSDFAEAEIAGQYSYKTITQSIRKIVTQSIPALTKKNDVAKSTNDFSFLLTVHDADFFKAFFDVPLEINEPVILNGFFNDRENRIQTLLLAPDFSYDGTSYKDADISCNSEGNKLNYNVKVSRLSKKGATNFSIEGNAQDNALSTKLAWNNTDTLDHTEGTLNTTTRFFREEGIPLSAIISVEPSVVEIGDSIWNIKQSSVNISNGQYAINNLSIEHKAQHLNINGVVNPNGNDSIIADLNEMDLEYIFDVLNFHPVELAGLATGKVKINNILSSLNASAHLYVRKFTFNEGHMGDMNIYGSYDNKEGNINLNAQIMEPTLSTTTVQGYVSPDHDELDLRISANNSNLDFLKYYVGEIFPEIEGRGTGHVHVFGPLKFINIEGDMVADISAKVKALGTTYNLRKQKIHMVPNCMEFSNIAITDREGHKGLVNGAIYHNCLKQMRYKFQISSDGLLCYDFNDFGDNSFYGTVYGAGNVELDGGPGYLNIDVNMTSRPKTLFVYNASQPDEITNQSFITFVDHSKAEEEADSHSQTSNYEVDDEMDLRIGGVLNATEAATLRVIMDKNSGDHIQTYGNGNIHFSYYNKGRFNMYGTYTLQSGTYKLSMQQVIHKDFRINRGGTVVFAGDPYDADLNVQAVYTIPSASLNDLSPGTSFNQSTVRVNCLMNITGKARQPQITFDLELPTTNDEERQLVNSIISTEEEKNTQIIYLLGIGRFYTNDYTNTEGTSQSASAMNSLLSSTLSGQLNQILSQTINNNNWNFGANLSTGEHGWNDMDVEGILQGRLLNNRLLFNGNFGYRENSLTANTNNWIGDFDIQYLLTPNGSISLKGYNMTNDRYFTKATLTTQGIGIVFKKELNSWRDLFRFKKQSSSTDTLKSE